MLASGKLTQLATSSCIKRVFPRHLMTSCRRCGQATGRKSDKYKKIDGVGYALLIFPGAAYGLGCWQIYRWNWKLGLIGQIEQRSTNPPIPLPEDLRDLSSMTYTPVVVRGEFLHDREIVVTPRSNINYDRGTGDGGHVITPFKLADRSYSILVNRGYVGSHRLDPKTRPGGQVAGEVELVGLVAKSEKTSTMGMGNAPEDGQWTAKCVPQIAQWLGTAPVLLDADKASTVKGGPSGGQTKVELRNQHVSYIVTWFLLGACTTYMWYKRYKTPAPVLRSADMLAKRPR